MSEEKRQQVIALGRLGWPSRGIQQEETGIRRETAGAYLKAALEWQSGDSGGWGRRASAKPANEVSPDFGPVSTPGRSPSASACEPYFDFIELSLSKGRNTKAIYQDLVDDHGLTSRYQSVKRFVRRLRGQPLRSFGQVIGPREFGSHTGRISNHRSIKQIPLEPI